MQKYMFNKESCVLAFKTQLLCGNPINTPDFVLKDDNYSVFAHFFNPECFDKKFIRALWDIRRAKQEANRFFDDYEINRKLDELDELQIEGVENVTENLPEH